MIITYFDEKNRLNELEWAGNERWLNKRTGKTIKATTFMRLPGMGKYRELSDGDKYTHPNSTVTFI